MTAGLRPSRPGWRACAVSRSSSTSGLRCGPCRFEFPFFQHLSKRYSGRVAFLGVDAKDARSDATAFLNKFPVLYPHFYDEDASIARTFGGGRAWPTTAFFDRTGKLVFTHIGAYATQAKLDQDIARYALNG